jgi:hypothetical protein
MPGPANDYLLGAHRHITRLGSRIVENHGRDKDRSGKCYMVTYDRIQVATQQVGDGRPLAPMAVDDWPRQRHRMFYAIWGSSIDIGKEKWLQIPEVFRGRGAPAAMIGDGRGDAMYEADQIWAGALEPGAVLQTWTTVDDYIRVLYGNEVKLKHRGHSFIHKNYVYSGSAIVGMKVIDNGYHGTKTVSRGSWGYWIATNVRCLGAGATPRIPDPWWPEEPAESEEVAAPAHYGPPG